MEISNYIPLLCQYNPNRVQDNTIAPSINDALPDTPTSLSGIIVSYRFARKHSTHLKAIALAVAIKQMFPSNGTIYGYTPAKVGRLFNLNYNTSKAYVNYLLSEGIARLHKGNLTVGILRMSRCKKNCFRVSGDRKSIVDQIRQQIIKSNIQRQKNFISRKEEHNSAALCRNYKETKRFFRLRKSADMVDQRFDDKVRMTLNKIQFLLRVSRAKSVEIRRSLIDQGYGFCYETTLLQSNARGVDVDILPGNAYIHRGAVLIRESWVDF